MERKSFFRDARHCNNEVFCSRLRDQRWCHFTHTQFARRFSASRSPMCGAGTLSPLASRVKLTNEIRNEIIKHSFLHRESQHSVERETERCGVVSIFRLLLFLQFLSLRRRFASRAPSTLTSDSKGFYTIAQLSSFKFRTNASHRDGNTRFGERRPCRRVPLKMDEYGADDARCHSLARSLVRYHRRQPLNLFVIFQRIQWVLVWVFILFFINKFACICRLFGAASERNRIARWKISNSKLTLKRRLLSARCINGARMCMGGD